jgi:L-amino acid N-acyltransferase YncA
MMGSAFTTRLMEPADWEQVRRIYVEGIATGNATFEEDAPTREAFMAGHRADLCFVAVAESGSVAGWVAASAVSSRCVYAGVVQHSVYVADAARGRGVGRLLLGRLIEASEALGIWTIESGVFPENQASRRLHASCGFRDVGTRERLGQHRGVWRDVIWIERRSPHIH